MGPIFTSILGGGAPIAPAFPTYLPLTLSSNTVLYWPTELAPAGVPVVSDIIDVNATTGGLAFQFSDARQVSPGYSALINNVGVNTFSVEDAQGNVLVTPTSGQVWQVYLADNSTIQGTWRVFQFGAGVSNANAAALAGAGLKAITTTLNERILIQPQNANYNVVASDRATCIEWVGGSGGTITLDPVALGADFFCYIKNAGTGVVSVAPASGTIDGGANLSFNLENSAAVVSDGTNLITLGFGQRVNSAFDFVQISLAGDSGNVTLTGANLNRISYRFTGALTGNTTIILPQTIQQYWVDNETTDAFSLTFSTGVGTTVTVPQGSRAILYCDGTNIVLAQTAGSLTFSSGTAAAPGITFTADTTTGIYLAATHVLAFSSDGVERAQVDATGHWTFEPPDTFGAGTYTVTVDGPLPSGTALLVSQQLQSTTSPAMVVQGSGVGSFALMSLQANGAVVGTSDFLLGQNSSLDALLTNQSPGGALRLGTDGTDRIVISNVGGVSVDAPLSGIALAVTAVAGSASPALELTAVNTADSPQLWFSRPTAGVDAVLGSAGTGGALVVGSSAGDTVLRGANGAVWLASAAANGALRIAGTGASQVIQGWGPTHGALVDMTTDTGTFNGAATGMTTAVNYPCTWTRSGKLVTLTISGAAGTSNSTGFTMTGLPPAIQPATLTTEIQLNPMRVFDNGSRVGTSAIVEAQIVAASGTITFLKGALTTGWTASGTKGITAGDTVTIPYLLN